MELLRRLVLLPFAAAASVSLRNTAALERGANSSFAGKGKFDISQLSTAFDDGESLEPPDWIKKMTEHFDFSPSSRKAAEKAWANAAHLDGEGGDELPSSEMGLEDGGMFSGMGEGAMPAGMAEAMEKMGGMKGAGFPGMSAGGATLMPGGAGMPGGSRPLPGGSSAAPSAFNPKRAGAGGSGPAVGGQRAAASAAAPPEERDPDFTGEMPAEGGGPGLANRALEQARAALRDAERAMQEAERAKKAAILAGRQLGADLTKELPDARMGPTRDNSVEPPEAGPTREAASGHKSAGGNGPAIGKQRRGGGGGGGGGGGSDGEGADELPENMLEDDVVVPPPRRASSASRVENFDDGEGGQPEE